MRCVIGIIFLFSVFSVYSNGGPVETCTAGSTGQVAPIKVEQVQLLKEDLHFHIIDDYVKVDVVYELKNLSQKDQVINYGFPIDYFEDHYGIKAFKWEDDLVKDFRFTWLQKDLEIKETTRDSIRMKDVLEDADNKLKGVRQWFLSELSIKANQQGQLKVSYYVKAHYTDWATSKSFYSSYGSRNLWYDFTPAANWGDGKVGELNIELSSEPGIETFKWQDSPHLKESDKIQHFKNINLIELGTARLYFTNQHVKFDQDMHRCSSMNAIKRIECSSTLKGQYSGENLVDGNPKTAWVEGSKAYGIGDKIEIYLDEVGVGAIALLNGYTKSKETYENNARIKKVRVHLVGEEGWIDDWHPLDRQIEFELEDIPWKEMDEAKPWERYNLEIDFGGGLFCKLEKVSIEILEVYEGKKYEDTCVSELFLIGFKVE